MADEQSTNSRELITLDPKMSNYFIPEQNIIHSNHHTSYTFLIYAIINQPL